MAPECAFCQIAAGTKEAAVVFRNEHSLAFLDTRPLFAGHCLLIPRHHYESLADLPRGEIGPLFRNAQLLAQALEDGLGADGSFVAINNRVSQSVPHLHVHAVPRRKKDGLRGFFWPRGKYRDTAEVEHIRAVLERAFVRLQSSGNS